MKRLLAIVLMIGAPAFVSAAEKTTPAAPQPVYVKLATTEGDIFLELDPAKAPKTVANFTQYVKDGHYTGVIFHRVIPGFMAQGGGYMPDFTEKDTREPIENESKNGLKNVRGTIAMARTNDPHSAAGQWFINLVDNPRLDGQEFKWGYAVFGKVVRGMDVVDSIALIPTGPAGPFQSDVPFRPVVINTAEVIDTVPIEEQAPTSEKKQAL